MHAQDHGHGAAAGAGKAGKAAAAKQQLGEAQAAFDAAKCKGFKKSSDTRPAAEKEGCTPLKEALDNAQKAHDEAAGGAGAGRTASCLLARCRLPTWPAACAGFLAFAHACMQQARRDSPCVLPLTSRHAQSPRAAPGATCRHSGTCCHDQHVDYHNHDNDNDD